ncbi:uncharacterized protein C6orf118-like [Periophthalmus magnuspinnatus]|uniref:uncharacterized protein C6orf118-like n=1 Tax=Periophthalmus magnuspinnatus TaxID=409849 RepID=UPI002436B0CF|nr:uncharacterized protein C6orf118-like [Periophthalmus magnuspinnatus]
MSIRPTKPKPGPFGRDIHRLLQAAEAGHRADILTYSSGHLGPRSLVLNQPHQETKQPFWATFEKHRETPKSLTPRKKQTKAVKNNMKEYLAEVMADFTSLTLEQTSALDHPNDSSFDAVPRVDTCLNNSLPCMRKPLPKIQPKSAPHKKSENTSKLRGRQSESDKGLSKKDQTQNSQELVKHGVWIGTNAADLHEKKLETELQKLSSPRWPCRDRLGVFSDVFGDVCESSTVFGRILREIKNDYDQYANHMMSILEKMPSQHSLKRPGTAPTGDLEAKKKEVHLLEQEAREALEENKRLKAELQTILENSCPEDKTINDTPLSEWDSENANGCDTTVQSKRRQVSRVWTEIQKLEGELQDKLVSTDITTAIEKQIRALKTEIMKLMVSNNQLEITNKDLEDKINTILQQEKISKAIRQILWSEIKPNL